MSGADDLTARINQAKANIESARQVLAEAGEIPKSIKISTPEEVVDLLKKGGISKAQLEARLIASGWHDVHGRYEDPKTGRSKQRVIWTNPRTYSRKGNPKGLDASVRIMTEPNGSSDARVYRGPTGGGEYDIGDGKTLPKEQVLDRDGKVVKPNAPNTHFPLRPDLPRPQGGALRGTLRGASKALGPIGVALDAYSLKEAWDADGGRIGENVTSTAGGIAGGLGGAAAGAAIGSAILPVGGTIIGGVIGGVVGSGAGSAIAEGIGNLFD